MEWLRQKRLQRTGQRRERKGPLTALKATVLERLRWIEEHGKRKRFPIFDYQPLKPGDIRVLDLLSQPGQDLRCRLRHVAFEDSRPPYVALSYVWGDAEQPFSMEVVGDNNEGVAGLIPLTTSLRNALQNLGDCEHFRQSRTFWIDQICIDQGNDVEKNHQVTMMMQIYEKASEVVTYLGPEEPGDEEAIRLLDRIYQFYDDKMRAQTDDPRLREIYSRLNELYTDPIVHLLVYKTYEDIPPELRFDVSTSDADQAAYSHLGEAIISTRWIERIWLVQENVVNKHAGFLRGTRYVAWDQVGLLCSLSWVGILPDVHSNGEVLNLHELRLQVLENGVNPNVFSNLYSVMDSFRGRKCTDLRDKIYAVLGLARDAIELGVSPEYGKCPAQVFTDVAVKHLQRDIRKNADDKLWVLTRAGVESCPDPLVPSWVPSFTSIGYLGTTLQHASKGRNASVSFQSTPSIDNAILVANGIRLEPLAREFGSFKKTLHDLMDMSDLDHIITVLDSVVARLGDSDKMCASICQTLLMDCTWPDGPETRTKDAADAFRDMRRVLDLARDGLRTEDRDYSELFQLPNSHPDVSKLAAYVIENSETMRRRALWVTERGDLVLAPDTVRSSDIPVVLLGGKWIYFLRPSGDMFEYMGWGHVHGFSNGEVFESKDWEKTVETFKIK